MAAQKLSQWIDPSMFTRLFAVRILLPLALVLSLGCSPKQISAQIDPLELVGPASTGRVVTPVNQILTPAGVQVELPGLRPQVICLSPDGQLLATSGKTHELILVDPVKGTILQKVPLPNEKEHDSDPDNVSPHILEPDKEGQVSYTGLIFSPDGRRIFLSNVNGSVKVFAVGTDHQITGLFTLSLPDSGVKARKRDIPAGLAISKDGTRLYVALNLSNRLLELEAATGKQLRKWEVGTAPYEVVLAGRKAYVSNWGGRRPEKGVVTGPAGRGTKVRVDLVRFIANEGSVSVIDLDSGQAVNEIMVGLHSSGLALTPDGRYLLVANAGSDTVSVIDTRADRVLETISVRLRANDLFGASPNALAFESAGKLLYVCNGTQNAVAVVSFRPGKSKLLGLVPTGWFPGAITYDSRRRSLYVANIKGVGAWKRYGPDEKAKFKSNQHFGTLSLLAVPDKPLLDRYTAAVLRNNRRAIMEEAVRPPRPRTPIRPVPERVGEPSAFEHVVYIIKENRTYDQVLGDMKEGNGDPSLCVFGEEVTPNQHKISREFVLLDNTYCSGLVSADGHQWTDSAFATDYMEKSFAGFPRSYPDGMEAADIDALAYSPAGFIWDNVLAHGKTLRDYGEFTIGATGWKDRGRKPAPKFLDFYRDFIQQTGLLRIGCKPAIESLGPYIKRDTIGWNLNVPDVFRAAQFIKELGQFERDGKFPHLSIICLPNDHTSGTKRNCPTPAAQVADNDLALGQIVEAISHSRFWRDTCLFAIEDDPQDGWDHVSSYRTTAYVVSPYTRRHAVIHDNFNQTSLLRTIELILGLRPMNQMDAAATPMFACFTNQPDFAAYSVVTNNIPLDQMNPEPKAIADSLQRRYAEASANLPLDQVDRCPEELLNRIIWQAQKGSRAPFPVWAITPKSKSDDPD